MGGSGLSLPENAALEGGAAGPRPRSLALDMARGAAVLAMVVYHTAWDLSELALIETEVTESLPWRLFARAIAASFLVLSGVSLVLAHGRGVRRGPFLRRLATLAGAALAVTVVTIFVLPDAYIFFGILHAMALSSLLALPFVRASAPVTAAVAVAVWTAPLVLTQPVFDAPVLAFLGLGTRVPITNDYVPVFPWTGFVLAGVAAARLAIRWRTPDADGVRAASPGRRARAARLLAAVGRRSLVIYLLHQPLIFGALSGLREIVGPNPVAEAAPFMTNCRSSCRAAGTDEALCRTACTCAVDELKRDGLWPATLANRLSVTESARASALARACFARAR